MSNITLTFSAPTLKDYTAIRETLFHVEQRSSNYILPKTKDTKKNHIHQVSFL